MKELFELKDIRPQITDRQADFIEKCIFMAKETENPQEVSLSVFARPLIVWPSGMIMFKPKEGGL